MNLIEITHLQVLFNYLSILCLCLLFISSPGMKDPNLTETEVGGEALCDRNRHRLHRTTEDGDDVPELIEGCFKYLR